MAVVGIDIFTGKKHVNLGFFLIIQEDIFPTSHGCTCPQVTREEYQLIDCDQDGFLTLMTSDGETREDLNLPEDEELANKIREMWEDGKVIFFDLFIVLGRRCRNNLCSWQRTSYLLSRRYFQALSHLQEPNKSTFSLLLISNFLPPIFSRSIYNNTCFEPLPIPEGHS